jgi:hypothetical protein
VAPRSAEARGPGRASSCVVTKDLCAAACFAMGLFAAPTHAHSGEARIAVDAYAALCGAGGEADAARSARAEALHHELDAIVAMRLGLGPHTARDIDAARRIEIARRIAPMRQTVEALFAEEVADATAIVAPSSGEADRLRGVHLRWIDPTERANDDARALRRGCGNDLLQDDAWVDKAEREVVLCPGFLLLAAGSPREVRAHVSFLLAHELGHVIAGGLAHRGTDERRAEQDADRWGARITAVLYAHAHGDALLRDLRLAVEPICMPKGDEAHASGRDRIGTLGSATDLLDRL